MEYLRDMREELQELSRGYSPKVFETENEFTKILKIYMFFYNLRDGKRLYPRKKKVSFNQLICLLNHVQSDILENPNLTIDFFQMVESWNPSAFFESGHFDWKFKAQYLSENLREFGPLFSDLYLRRKEERLKLFETAVRQVAQQYDRAPIPLNLRVNHCLYLRSKRMMRFLRDGDLNSATLFDKFMSPRFDLKRWLIKDYPEVKTQIPSEKIIRLLFQSINMTEDVMKFILFEHELGKEVKEDDFHIFFSNRLKKDLNFSAVIITDFLRNVKTFRRLASLRPLMNRLPDDLTLKILLLI